MSPFPIGGFLELEVPDAGGGFHDFWRIPPDPNLTFATARAALRALIGAVRPERVWVPAYICAVVPRQVPESACFHYRVGESLEPDVEWLESRVRPGDLLIGVNYFGRLPGAGFLSFVKARGDMVFVEDCAQTIGTGADPWGDWRLFSPRKVLGVPDGGILVPQGPYDAAAFSTEAGCDLESVMPLIERFEDTSGTRHEIWHARYEQWRSALTPSNRRMSRLTASLLGLADPYEVSKRRRDNFAVLARELPEFSFLGEGFPETGTPRSFVPFGFPVRLSRELRDRVRGHLWNDGIYTFRHFADLVSPPESFPDEHRLSSELMTLPCDQRYDASDMERIAHSFRSALAAG